MIISNSHKFIFVHIQKCAGTSVTRALDPILQWNDIQCGGSKYGEQFQQIYRQRFGLHKHSSAHEILEVVGEELWNEYFTFSVVRNPFARAVSLYTYVKRMVNDRGLKKYIRFYGKEKNQQLWSWPLTKAFLETRNFSEFIRHKNFSHARGSQPLFSFLSDKDGKNLIVDQTGKLENIEEDFDLIRTRIGSNPLSLGKDNISLKKKTYREFYMSDEDYELIYNLYKVDFEQFKYTPSELA